MTKVLQFEKKATLSTISEVVESLFQSYSGKVICLVGDLGAGKTTLIQHICKHLGYDAPVTSPTFSIINEYPIAEGKIVHLDLYRLKNLEEVQELGFEELIEAATLCLIEWPQIAEPLLPDNLMVIKIELQQDSHRKYIFVQYN